LGTEANGVLDAAGVNEFEKLLLLKHVIRLGENGGWRWHGREVGETACVRAPLCTGRQRALSCALTSTAQPQVAVV